MYRQIEGNRLWTVETRDLLVSKIVAKFLCLFPRSAGWPESASHGESERTAEVEPPVSARCSFEAITVNMSWMFAD